VVTSNLASGRPIANKTVHPSNAYLVRVAAERYNATNDTFIPWTGTTAEAFFTTDAAATVLIPGLGPFALTEIVAVPGTYQEQLPGSTMNALLPYIGQTVYQVVRMGTIYDDVKVVTPLVVRQPRYAGQA
jgi:hypothetical protein